MPVAIPAIAAAAASYGTTALIAGTVLEGTLAASLLSAGAGLIASTVTGGIIGAGRGPDISAGLNQPGAGRTFQFRQPTAPRQVVLGRAKVSGPVMFMHSAPDDGGRADGYFYLQLALAGHRCRKVGDIFINDDYSSASQFAGLVSVGKNLGSSTQLEDALFLSDLGSEIFGDHWLRGVANIAARLKGNAEAFPNGLPNLSALLWGADEIYDPRTDTTGFTNNAALCYAWWKSWSSGMKVAWDDIDEDTLIDSANTCDQRVRVRSSTTTFSVDTAEDALTLAVSARALDVGDGVRVESTGGLPAPLAVDTTYYVIPSDAGTVKLATSVANAFSENPIDLTTTGSGTLTLRYWDEARYKLNGSFTLDQDKGQIQGQLLSAMMGFDVEVGGRWFIHAAAPTTPTQTIDEDDLRGTMTSVPKRSMRDKFNGVRARFVNPSKFWQPDDAPPVQSAIYLGQDNGIPLWEDANFPFTTSGQTVQRLMKIHLERNRLQRAINFQAMYTAIPLRPLAGAYINWDRYGWEQKQTLVMGWKLTQDFGVDLVLQDDSPTVHDWNPETEERFFAEPQGVTLPDPSAITAPVEVTVTTPTTPTFTHVAAQWSEVSSIWLDGYDVEYRDAGGSDWTGYGRVGKDISRDVSLERATSQDVRVRAVTRNGKPSDFTTNLAPGVPTSYSATGGDHSIALTWTNDVDAAQIQIFEGDTLIDTVAVSASPQTYGVGSLGVSESHTYDIRSVNAGGNFSALVSASGTTDPDGGGD